jgi:hypothetical protein
MNKRDYYQFYQAIYKYSTIPQILNSFEELFHIFLRNDQINEQNNILIILRNKSKYKFYFFRYFDWYPHVELNYLYLYQFEYNERLLQIIEKIIKSQDKRKWDIFVNYKKRHLEFNDFIIQFIFKNNKISHVYRVKFLSPNQQKKIKCSECDSFQENVNIGNYLICKYYTNTTENDNLQLCLSKWNAK